MKSYHSTMVDSAAIAIEPRDTGSWATRLRTVGRAHQPCAPTVASGRHSVKVVLVRILDNDLREVSDFQPSGVAQLDLAVDLGRVGG